MSSKSRLLFARICANNDRFENLPYFISISFKQFKFKKEVEFESFKFSFFVCNKIDHWEKEILEEEA